MKTTFVLAWRNLWRNKRRSLIAMASVTFAVLFSVLMNAVQYGSYDRMIEKIVGGNFGFVQLHANGYWEEQNLDFLMPEDPALEATIRQQPDVSIRKRLQSFALASTGTNSRGIAITGLDVAAERSILELDQLLVAGNLERVANGELLVGEGLANLLEVHVGDSLILLGSGYQGQSASGLLSIGAVVKFRSPELNKNMALLELQHCQELFAAPGMISAYLLNVPNYRQSEQLAVQVASKVDSTTYEVMAWSSMLPEIVQTIQADASGGYVMMFILYVVIGFGLLGTVLMMTAERKREMGILVSIGMKKGQLARVALLENTFLGLLGASLGVLIVRPIQWYLNKYPIDLGEGMGKSLEDSGFEALLPASLDWGIAFTHMGIVLFLSLLIGLYPLITILRLNPLKAMRS